MSDLGPEAERVQLTAGETVRFMRIVQTETHRSMRTLIDRWASPGNPNPHAERALTLTLAAMWRSSNERQEENR